MNRNQLQYRVRDARTERPFELNPFALSSNVSFSCMWLRLGRRVPRRLSNHILNRVRNIGSDMSISGRFFGSSMETYHKIGFWSEKCSQKIGKDQSTKQKEALPSMLS